MPKALGTVVAQRMGDISPKGSWGEGFEPKSYCQSPDLCTSSGQGIPLLHGFSPHFPQHPRRWESTQHSKSLCSRRVSQMVTLSPNPHTSHSQCCSLPIFQFLENLKQFNQNIGTHSPEGWQGRHITLLIMHGPDIPPCFWGIFDTPRMIYFRGR